MPKSAIVPTCSAPARTSKDLARRPWAHRRSGRRHGGCEGRKSMLRITDTLHVTPDGRATWTLRLEGTLKDEWVRELRRAWRRIREAEPGVPIRVELADVRFVDPAGKVLLAEMYRDGVEIVAGDCLAAVILDGIVERSTRDRRAR